MKNARIYVVGLAAFLFGLVAMWLYVLFTPVVTQDKGVIYYLRPGTSKRLAISELTQQGIIQRPIFLYLYALPQKNAVLKTGEYLFPKGATPLSIWRQVTTGTGLLYRRFTIIPGWTFSQLRDELLKAPALKHSTATMNDQTIIERLGISAPSLEGEFFPETYLYTRNAIDLTILKRAHDLLQAKINEAWQHRAANLPYNNAYEALIAASMIEKEGYLDAERPMISGVLINRLHKDMLLQIDATVIYGLGSRYDGKIYKSNLVEDTPYNTYIHKGLPPTPIAMPGLSSIEAALHPQQSDYYYYVAKGDGSHQFSASLAAHNTAIKASANAQNNTITETIIRQHVENLTAPLLMH